MTTRNVLFASILAAGLAVAQTATTAPAAGWRHGGPMAEMQLTDTQKTQVHQIFEDSRTAAQPIEAQMKAVHEQMAQAIKGAAPEATIDQLANQAGTLHGQVMALHAKSAAKVYAMLTPEQKAKADAMGDRFLMMGPGGGMGPGAMGRGPRPAPNQ